MSANDYDHQVVAEYIKQVEEPMLEVIIVWKAKSSVNNFLVNMEQMNKMLYS